MLNPRYSKKSIGQNKCFLCALELVPTKDPFISIFYLLTLSQILSSLMCLLEKNVWREQMHE